MKVPPLVVGQSVYKVLSHFSLEHLCSRPWKACEHKGRTRSRPRSPLMPFTGSSFTRQVCNEMWLQNIDLRRWQVFSHGRSDSATGSGVGRRREHPAPNVTPRESRYTCRETALMEYVCRWLSGAELTEVDWIWIKVCSGAWKLLFPRFTWCGECEKRVPPCGGFWYDSQAVVAASYLWL